MVVNLKDLHAVLFALHLEHEQGTTLDPNGAHSRALWDAVLPLSLPEPDDPPVVATWQALVKLSEAYAQLADQPVVSQPNTIKATVTAPGADAIASRFIWH